MRNDLTASPAGFRPVHRHLDRSHPLAEVAAGHCRTHGTRAGTGIGGVACGACWERAIRDDEQVAIEHGLPRELTPDPGYVDQVALAQACAGKRVRLTDAERAEAAERLYARGLTRVQVARRLRVAADQIPQPVAVRAPRTARSLTPRLPGAATTGPVFRKAA